MGWSLCVACEHSERVPDLTLADLSVSCRFICNAVIRSGDPMRCREMDGGVVYCNYYTRYPGAEGTTGDR